MAQRPSHRLNLYLVPSDPERTLDPASVEQGLSLLRADGVLDGMRPGPRAAALIEGGFALVRLDAPTQPTLYGNRQGGYRVRCPACGGSAVTPALDALKAWRLGGARAATCPACGAATALEALDYAPFAAPGRFALELRDVGGASVAPDATRSLEVALGGAFVVVGSRG